MTFYYESTTQYTGKRSYSNLSQTMKRLGYFYCCAWNWIHLKQPPVECFCFTIILIFPGQFHIGPRARVYFWPLMTFLLMTIRSHLLIRSRTFQENICIDLLFFHWTLYNSIQNRNILAAFYNVIYRNLNFTGGGLDPPPPTQPLNPPPSRSVYAPWVVPVWYWWQNWPQSRKGRSGEPFSGTPVWWYYPCSWWSKDGTEKRRQ